jgi:hypothetical protein
MGSYCKARQPIRHQRDGPHLRVHRNSRRRRGNCRHPKIVGFPTTTKTDSTDESSTLRGMVMGAFRNPLRRQEPVWGVHVGTLMTPESNAAQHDDSTRTLIDVNSDIGGMHCSTMAYNGHA